MSDLAISSVTNDLVVQSGDLFLVHGEDAIAQDVQQTLQMFLGEWFLDTTVGIPYLQLILIKNPNLDIIQATLMEAALAVDGVTDILDFEFGFDSKTRALSVVPLQLQTTNGQVIKAQANIGQLVTGQGGGT